MSTRALASVVATVLGLGLGALVPRPAEAAGCLRNEFGEIYVIEATGFSGGIFSLAGEWVIGGLAGGGGHPFVGTAHFRPDGKIHFAFIIGAAAGPLALEGTLDPPGYTSGTATERGFVGAESSSPRTLAAVACPPLID
jgi:hypothetical protein